MRLDEPRLTIECLAMSCRGEPGRSELHLGERNGSVFTFPVYPDYSLDGDGAEKELMVIIDQNIVLLKMDLLKRLAIPDCYC